MSAIDMPQAEQANEAIVTAEHEHEPQQPQSEWTVLRQYAEENPYHESSWEALIDKAEETADLDKIKETYDALLEKYPNTASAQISYLNHFLTNPASFGYAEGLFARFLRTSPSVDLWKFYIVYVRRVNTGPSTRDTVRKAYEFALSHVGQDKDSGDIWADYIQFVKSGESTTTWEEQQKMDALRKIYHRAVQIPLENVEILWKEYETFENSLNKITAKKFMQDLTQPHMQARAKLRELRRFLGPLLPPPPASITGRPPLHLPHKPTYNPNDRALVGSWKQYLKWEEGNPLVIEDKNMLNSRLQGVYRKAVIRMRYFSEIWFMAYSWASNAGRNDEAMSILKGGIEANPTSFVLNFALAESQELSKNYSDVHTTYTSLLQGMQGELEALEAKIAATTPNSSFTSSQGDTGIVPTGVADDPNAMKVDSVNGGGLTKEASFVTQKTNTSLTSDISPLAKEMRERRQEYGLVYIMYIRFALRAEGVDASRGVFSKARKDKWTPWEVFEAAAFMEYHVAKQLVVANKILGLAHTRFPDEIDFVVRYLEFLTSVNDENNARALFERAVSNFPPEKAKPLWDTWTKYEYQYGNLEAALRLEKRMAEVYPNDPPIKRFALRHTYRSIDGVASRDLGFSMSRQGSMLSRSDTLPTINAGAGSSSSVFQPSASQPQILPSTSLSALSAKRAASPDRGPRRDDAKSVPEHGYPHKRSRDVSPPFRDRERDRDRWTGGPSKDRRYGSPAWERDRERERSPRRHHEREEPPKPTLPQVLNWFVSTLPPPSSFDGPVFRTDDLMQLFRNAVIPGSSGARPRSPPPPSRPTRPPPDYGPYRGPSSGRGGRY